MLGMGQGEFNKIADFAVQRGLTTAGCGPIFRPASFLKSNVIANVPAAGTHNNSIPPVAAPRS